MKTIEEAIQDLGLSINYEENNYDAGIAVGFEKGAKWALKNRWIMMEDDWPKPFKTVLLKTYLYPDHYNTGWRTVNNKGKNKWYLFPSGEILEDKDIIAWMIIIDFKNK